MPVSTGLDILVAESFSRLSGLSVGLCAHPASVDAELRHIVHLMHEAGVKLTTLLGPEHGILGDAQDMEVVEEATDATDPLTGARVYSLYGHEVDSLRPTEAMMDGLDVVVVDMQDVGARYYTFAATMVYVMQTAAKTNTRVLVLDRPNPLGGRDEDVEGPDVHEDFRSFVGAFDLPIRHGLTMGEYAHFMKATLHIDVELEVVKMSGWTRDMDYEATGLPWVFPSPNMPTVDTAWIYPGMCLFEGTKMSEARGTTRPFELCGAPYIDGVAWKKKADEAGLPGITLRPAYFTPQFQKQAGLRCGGVQIHVTDRWAVRPTRLGVVLLAAARAVAPDAFEWRTERYEYVTDRLAIDLLFGGDAARKALESGASADDVVATWADNEKAFVEARRASLLYT